MKIKTKIFLSFIFIFNFTFNLYAQGYICAVGGGSEDYNNWSDAPYSWVVQKSDSGKIIILGVSSVTEWLPTSGYEYGNAPDIEVYLNSDPENPQYEVWISVSKKEK